MMRRAACAAMAFCIASGAQAQTVRYKRFANPDNEKDAVFNRIYLAGVRDALQTVNGSFVAQGVAPLFCMPSTLVLSEEQAADIVTRTAAKATRNIDDMPIAIILLRGLKETFPCGEQSK
jgi:Rap1a immunity proteins